MYTLRYRYTEGLRFPMELVKEFESRSLAIAWAMCQGESIVFSVEGA